MKLGIAIPLKAKAVSKNWNNVEGSLLMTLNSIKNQLNQNFIAFVKMSSFLCFLHTLQLCTQIYQIIIRFL